MSNDNARIFDDLTRVAGGAVSILSALGKQVQAGLQDHAGKSFNMGTSTRPDDVERLQGVITKLRVEQEELKARIATLESMMGVTKKVTTKKVTTKKTTSKAAAKTSAKSKKAPAKKSSRK